MEPSGITIICSPLKATSQLESQANIAYARRAVRDSLLRNEIPFASHVHYALPGVLDDDNLKEREIGMNAGLRILSFATAIAFYIDRGLSPGMYVEYIQAKELNLSIEPRSLLMGEVWCHSQFAALLTPYHEATNDGK